MAVSVGPVLEEHVYRAGLLKLQRVLGDAELLSFPKRPNGTAVLLRQSFFERLLSGNMDLVSFPAADVIAAQADVRNLSLPQLLSIRCGNLDFNGGTPSMRAQSEFLATVDQALEKRIAASLAARGAVKATSGQAADLVRLVVLVYGVHAGLDSEAVGCADYWLVRLGDVEAGLLLSACELVDLESLAGAQAYCHRNLSRASAAVGRNKKQLHWEVEVADPSSFEGASQARSPPTRRARASMGRPSLRGGPAEESPTAGGAPRAPEVTDVVRKPLEETGGLSVEALQRELAVARAGEEKANATCSEALRRCKELEAAKGEAEQARDAALRDLQAVRADLEALRELAAGRDEAEQARAMVARELEALRAELAALKDARAAPPQDAVVAGEEASSPAEVDGASAAAEDAGAVAAPEVVAEAQEAVAPAPAQEAPTCAEVGLEEPACAGAVPDLAAEEVEASLEEPAVNGVVLCPAVEAPAESACKIGEEIPPCAEAGLEEPAGKGVALELAVEDPVAAARALVEECLNCAEVGFEEAAGNSAEAEEAAKAPAVTAAEPVCPAESACELAEEALADTEAPIGTEAGVIPAAVVVDEVAASSQSAAGAVEVASTASEAAEEDSPAAEAEGFVGVPMDKHENQEEDAEVEEKEDKQAEEREENPEEKEEANEELESMDEQAVSKVQSEVQSEEDTTCAGTPPVPSDEEDQASFGSVGGIRGLGGDITEIQDKLLEMAQAAVKEHSGADVAEDVDIKVQA